MDFVTIGSFFLYLGTFFLGIILDKDSLRNNKQLRKVYIIWLYIFLCFGYMTGQDWNTYERTYTDGIGIERYLTEPISYFLFSVFPKIIPDFWIFNGLFKCIFLYTLIRFFKKLTPYWLSTVAITMPICLLFLLISCPFRFMLALCFILLAILKIVNYLTNKKNLGDTVFKCLLFVALATCIHNTSALYFILLPLLFLSKRIARSNGFILCFLYIGIIVLTSNLFFLTDIKNNLSLLIMASGGRDYGSWYEYEDDASLFAIGNMINLIFMILLVFSRGKLIKHHPNGEIILGSTFIYFFIARLLIFVPNGFRLAFPFAFFYAISVIDFIKTKNKSSYIILLYIVYSLVKTTWFSYDMIPYSNSIPYIISGHKPYSERLNYNRDAYLKRVGDYDKYDWND